MEKTIVKTLAENTISWEGGALPAYPVSNPKVTVLSIVIPPHSRLADHHHDVINAVAVVRGELTVVALSGEERTFFPGEAFIEMVGKTHFGENRTDEDVELIAFYAGTPGMPLSSADV